MVRDDREPNVKENTRKAKFDSLTVLPERGERERD
jgi:hypothetical protein